MSDQAEPIGAEGVVEAGKFSFSDDFAAECRVRHAVLSCIGKGLPTVELAVSDMQVIAAMLASTPAPKAAGVEREAIATALYAELGDTYDCTRVWSAWDCGTMGEDDFEHVTNRIDEIVASVLTALRAVDAAPGGGVTHSSRGNCPDCDGTGYEGGFSGNENSEAACHPCLGTGSTPTAAPAPNVQALDGNEIWEALFGIMKGDVPDELTEAVCDQLAAALAAIQAPAGEGVA